MATTNTMQVELTYTDYDTRTYKIPYQGTTYEDMEAAKTKIRAFNTAAATSDSAVQQTFLSNDGARVARISGATLISRNEEVLYSVN